MQNSKLEAESWLYGTGLGTVFDVLSQVFPAFKSAADAFRTMRGRRSVTTRRRDDNSGRSSYERTERSER